MAAKYYAWTTIVSGSDKYEPGATVSSSKFSDDDWDQLVAAGSVRTRKFPDMPSTYQGSPAGFRLWQFKQLQEGLEIDLDDDSEEEMFQLELEDADE